MNAKLLCETDTPAVDKKILKAAKRVLGGRTLETFFEHGQWWVQRRLTGAQWSVCDSSDPCGFSFEQVTEGDEE